jgi:AcrR family transcriptional regulator
MGRLNITAVRRQQIIDATLRVLARKGWNETSIDEISREADVSRGLVSYHFGDKSALLAGVLERCEQIFRRGGSAARDAATDPVERQRLSIRNGIIAVRDFPLTYEVVMQFVIGGRSDPELAEKVREFHRNSRDLVAQRIRDGQSIGVFRREIDADAAAARHMAVCMGVAQQWLLEPGSFDIEEVSRQSEEMMMTYLTGKQVGREAVAASA